MLIKVKGVKVVRKPNGQEYYYWRKTMEALPRDFPSLLRRVEELRGERPTREPDFGTWGSLVARYRQSPEYKEKADLTQRDYDRHLEAISRVWGDVLVSDTNIPAVLDMRDRLSEKPRKANYRLQVLSILFNFGAFVDPNQFGTVNSVHMRRMKLKEGDGYLPWPDNVINDFEKAAYKELRWIVMGGVLETGQRGCDAIRLPWTHYNGKGIEVFRQSKRGALVYIPASKKLREILKHAPRKHIVIFTTKSGKPWTLGHLRHEVTRILEECGHTGYSLHGLRSKQSQRLHAAGASLEAIGAILGHSRERMTREYVEKAEKASDAVIRLDAVRDSNKSGN